MEGSYCCELCEKRAMMQCDSDQAKLCWDCDEKVHSANFLVAKHSRVLLCRLCHSPTPWKASGPKLPPTVSFCHRCLANRATRFQHVSDDDDDDDGECSSDSDDEDGENQVVPMSSAASVESDTQDETACSSSALTSSDESTSVSIFRPFKERRINQRNR